MTEGDKNISDIELDQKNTIMQFWTDAKDSIFNVIFVILDKKSEDQQEQSIFGLIFQIGLDYIQIMAFPFNELVIDAWNGGDSLTSITNFFQKFNVSNYLPGAPYQIFLTMLYGLILIILLILVDIVYVSYSFSKKKFNFTFPLVILAQIVPLFITVLFLPITEILLNVVNCQKSKDGRWQMINYPTVTCWEGWHLFHATITLLFATIFVLISSIVALALFQPRLTSKKMTARQNSNGEVVFIINKIVLQFFFSFSPFNDPTFYVVIMFILSFWQFWCYVIQKPYYSKTTSKFFKICSTYYFWTALMLFIGLLLSDYHFNGAVLIWMGGLPFFALIIYFDIDLQISQLFSSNLKFKTGEQLQSHISYVLQLVQNQKDDKNSYMLLIGYIQKHKQICRQWDCPLKQQIKKSESQQKDREGSQLIIKQIQRMFITGLQKFPQCTKLRISYAFFNLQMLRNTQKAYEQFENTSKLNPNFQQQFNIYRFKKIIRQNLQNRQQSQADLVEIIRYENHVSLLQEAMLISAKLHKQFWSQLKQQTPNLKRLNSIGSQITQNGNVIAENYIEICKINSTGCQILYSYANYLILVNQDYNDGKELLSNARKMYCDKQSGPKALKELEIDNQNLLKILNPMIIISNPSSSSSKLINTNLLFTQITGYRRQQILNQPLLSIQPNIYSISGHSGLLLHQCKQYQNEMFFKHKYNYIISLAYKVIPQIDNKNFNVLFKMKIENSMRLILLCNLEGEITDYNLQAQMTFKDYIRRAQKQGESFKIGHLGLSICQDVFKYKTVVIISNKQVQCSIQISPLNIEVKGIRQQSNEQDESMILTSKKQIGYKISMIRSTQISSQKNKMVLKQHINELNDISNDVKVLLKNDIVDLYNHPNLIQVYTPSIVENKHEQNETRFQLKQKISTMRLMNNEIKMVYTKDNQNDYNYDSQNENQDDLQIFKFDDESYQAKLKTAINTNLEHIEVKKLRWVSFIFLIVLFLFNIFTLVAEYNTMSNVTLSLQQNTLRAKQYSLLTNNILAVLNATKNYQASQLQIQNNLITFQTDVRVNMILQNNLKVDKNLKDAVILLNSRLLNYFKNPLAPMEIKAIFLNYILSIYPAFFNYPIQLDTNHLLSYILTASIILIAIIMMIYWIYISLLIDKKRYDIMIWFLDIPIPYVTHLGNHCDEFLKKFLSVKELTQKGISLQQQQDDIFEQFSIKKNAGDEQDIQEQIKSRKSLISKNKKQTLISKLNLSFLKVIWLLIYSSLFSTILLILSHKFLSTVTFLNPQFIQTTRSIVVDNTIAITMQLIDDNIIKDEINLNDLLLKLSNNHKGVISTNNLQQFNFLILQHEKVAIASIYNTLYFENICKVLNLSPLNLVYCQSLVGSKLKSGYSVYSKYLINPQRNKYNQIKTSTQLFIVPALIQLLNIWQKQLILQSQNAISLCSILLYVFIIISGLSFIIFWLYYLRKLNTELNQTIQMLNMIPFKLLPKSRKQTKLFIGWIIRQANKAKHEVQ